MLFIATSQEKESLAEFQFARFSLERRCVPSSIINLLMTFFLASSPLKKDLGEVTMCFKIILKRDKKEPD